MGSESEPKPNSTPKLSLFSLPNQSPEPPGMLTPPLRPPASVPFMWEEAPGKPRTSNNKLISDTARCLELPPRLLTEAKITNIPSPTTVLEGPYIVGRSSSFSSASFSLSRERGQGLGHSKRENKERERERGGHLLSWRKRNVKGNEEIVEGNFVISPCSSSLSSATAMYVKDDDDEDVNGGGENTKVKITRFRRKGSFLGLSSTSSHLWASIYGTFKQMVPWRSRKIKKREESRDHHFLNV